MKITVTVLINLLIVQALIDLDIMYDNHTLAESASESGCWG